MIYEVFLTFQMEMHIVWKARQWSYPKVAYILNRYGGIGLNIFYLYCVVSTFSSIVRSTDATFSPNARTTFESMGKCPKLLSSQVNID